MAWYAGVAAGVLGIVWSLVLVSPTATLSPVLHGALFTGSALLLAGSVVRIAESRRPANIGNFVLVDPLRLWEVEPPEVTELELDGLSKAHCRHKSRRGAYAGSDVDVTLPGGTETVGFTDRESAKECTKFLNAVAKLMPADPTEVAVRAAAHARGEAEPGEDDLRAATRVPPPAKAGARRSRPRRVRRGPAGAVSSRLPLVLACTAVPALLCAAFLFPRVRANMREEHAYAAVTASREGLDEIDAYLRDYPEGRFAEDVRILRDRRRFEQARAQSERDRSPDPLRGYLADPRNQRHRRAAEQQVDRWLFRAAREKAERDKTPDALRAFVADPEVRHYKGDARELIEEYYDAALARYRERPKTEEVDATLVEGLDSVVRRLRRTKEPALLVRFEHAYEIEPQHPSLQLALVLSRMVLVQPGASFRDEAIESREKELLDRLGAAVTRAFGPGLFAVRKAAKDEEPDIEIVYTVSASATELNVSSGGRFTVVDAGAAGKFRKVMHKYDVNSWIVFQGRRERRSRVYGGPDKVIELPEMEKGGDPYESMLASAFDNLAQRLLAKLALAGAVEEATEER